MMRFHVVSLPHTHVTDEFSACAFTNKVRNFCRMMKSRGHTVFLYAGEKSDAPCDEHIVCISEADRAAHVGSGHYSAAPWDIASPAWRSFNLRAAGGIVQRHQQGDFVCVIGGAAHKPIADLLPECMVVEFGVGYGGTFAPYKVFESYAWMHMHYGAASMGDPCAANGAWWDAVIPGYLDPDQFPFKWDVFKQPGTKSGVTGRHGPIGYYVCGSEEERTAAERKHLETCNQCRQEAGLPDYQDLRPQAPPDYCLFIGRLIDRKGYRIAQEVCEDAGMRLVLAGEGPQTGYGEFVGVVDPVRRGELMAGAKAVFVPTLYVEPFGNVAIEAMACGTPVLSTDWGAMTETVVHGMTGFRCRTFGEFRRAIDQVGSLDPTAIRNHVLGRYSLPVIAAEYERYFERLSHLWKDGWYEGKAA